MTPSEIARKDDEDGFLRGYHGIPDNEKLQQMSFLELAALLGSCEIGSAKFSVVEREMKKHLAKDQAEISRKNIILGACMGGIFGLTGVVLGAWLKESPPTPGVARPNAVQQIPNGQLPVKSPAANLTLNAPPAMQAANNPPAPVQKNAQPSK